MIASNPFSDGLETEFGLRAAADVNNTGGEAFISFAAGHFFFTGETRANLFFRQGWNGIRRFCQKIPSIIFASG